MNDNNNPLDLLIKVAVSYGGTENILTAERFILALLDVADGTVPADDKSAYSTAVDLINAVCTDTAALKKLLVKHIGDEEGTSVRSRYHMQQAIQEAKVKAGYENSKVTPEMLLECVLRNPSPFILNSIVEINKKANGTASVSGNAATDSTGADDMTFVKKGVTSSSNGNNFGDIFANNGNNSDDGKKTDADGIDALAGLTGQVKELHDYLAERVLGQDKAISVVSSGYFRSEFLVDSDKKRKKPRGTFLFAGPPGVGKTFLAETFAEKLGREYKRFDMSEFSDHNAPTTFCGANAVWKDSQPGVVTSFVDENPKSVLLFDEIEKAHISVIYLFLQILDAGRLKDEKMNKEVDFKDTIIIFTTNAGRKLYEDTDVEDLSSVSRKVILKSLRTDINPDTNAPYFPAAICSRFATGNVVMFNHISAAILMQIVKKEINKTVTSFEKETGIKIEIDEKVYAAVLYAEGGTADARTITARAAAFFNDEIYEFFRLIKPEEMKKLKRVKIDVDLSKNSPEIVRFFNNDETPNVMVFSDTKTFEICKNSNDTCNYIFASSVEEAKKILKENDISTVLIDICVDANIDLEAYLNVEDVDSPSRDFLKFAREYYKSTAVYLLETDALTFSNEEMVSFSRQGIRGKVSVADGGKTFDSEMSYISDSIYRQRRMMDLAKSNRLLAFESAQQISGDGQNATIKLFDFELSVAVDSGEGGSILSNVSRPNVTFDDVIGAKPAIDELKYFVEYFKDPKQFIATGVKAPRGLILYGPPGTGKTLLAKAMAKESGVTFISTAGNEFVQKYIGEGKEKVHEIFSTARKYAPSIIFIDEVDAIAMERTGGESGSREKEATLTAFLAEMDGFKTDPTKPVFVLAATNFEVTPGSPKSLDAAFVRRFDRAVLVDLPDREAREKYLKKKIAEYPIIRINDKTFENVALRSTGKSLADLENVIELALRNAIRNKGVVTDDVFMEAFETYGSGDEKKWDEKYLERTARHEAGHAFVSWYTGNTPSYMTVVARANHGGYVQHSDDRRPILTREDLYDRIRISLAGRAAEIVYYGDVDGISTGASGDLQTATNVAQRIICNYGMDADFGLAVIDDSAQGSLADKIRAAVNKTLETELKKAVELIEANRNKIDALVCEIMVKNHLDGVEIDEIIRNA